MAGFRSLRERMAGAPDPNEVLPLNVLPHMRQPLMDWLESTTRWSGDDQLWTLLAKAFKIDYTGRPPKNAVVNALNRDNDLLLDLVDATLQLTNAVGYVDDLKIALYLAGSGWRVNDNYDGLEQVVDETVRAAVMETISKAKDSPGQHLANAWIETFGKDKKPTHAHSEMIRAVESAAIPVVTPNNLKATLGTIIGQLESQGSLYTTASASAANNGIAAVVAMMKMIWQQQTDRHGANPTIPATQERVELLLPIAAALVHTFTTRGVRRV